MKKLYIQPNTLIGKSFASSIICTSNPGSADAVFGGGSKGDEHPNEGNQNVDNTGDEDDDDMFSQGAKRRGFYTGF